MVFRNCDKLSTQVNRSDFDSTTGERSEAGLEIFAHGASMKTVDGS